MLCPTKVFPSKCFFFFFKVQGNCVGCFRHICSVWLFLCSKCSICSNGLFFHADKSSRLLQSNNRPIRAKAHSCPPSKVQRMDMCIRTRPQSNVRPGLMNCRSVVDNVFHGNYLFTCCSAGYCILLCVLPLK